MRFGRLPLFGLLIASPSALFATPADWLGKNVFQRIEIRGHRQFGFHHHDVEGDRETFNSLTYYGQGGRRFTDTGSVDIEGRNVLGLLNFRATLNDNRFNDPYGQRFSLNYNRGPLSFDAGDIQASLLNTNQFASMSKTVKGVSAQYKTGPLTVKAVRSDTKGSARTVSLQGNNSAGPYYLQNSQVIPDTQEVQVDGREMILGKDYVIDYELGSITFLDRVIPVTSTVLVTYESLGFNSTPGTVQGVGATYDLGKFGRLGLTTMEQKSRSGGGLSSRIERFQGFGAPSTPYFLQFEPLMRPDRPVTIRVDGLLQVEGIDYLFDIQNPAIFYFTRFMPATANIEVVYTPKPTSTVEGDRRVVGFDYRLPIGNGQSYLQYSQATGSLSGATPMSGTARGLTGVWNQGPWQIRAGWRDVPDTFVSVESRGFRRNERAFNFNGEYNVGATTYGLSHVDSQIGNRVLQEDGTFTFDRGRHSLTRAFANFGSLTGGPSWTLEQTRATSRIRGEDSRLDTTSATMNRSFGPVQTRAGFELQRGVGPVSDGLTTKRSGVNLHTLRLDADYRPIPALTLGARTSLSSIRTDFDSGTGRDIGLTMAYRPNERLTFNASYSDSDSGKLATLGPFQTGFGYGYEGSGFSGGLAGGHSFLGAPTNLRLFRADAKYRVTPKLGFDARFYQAKSRGSLTTNTDTTVYGISSDWDMGNGTVLMLSLDQSRTRFFDSVFLSQATSLDFALMGRPAGPWSYRLGANVLLSGGNSEFKQNSFYLDAALGYRIDPRQSVSLRWQQGRTTGYLPQNDSFVGMFYEYRIWENVALIGSYKWRSLTNSEGMFFTNGYRSRGFDLELSVSFGR
jgi:hypothetical protein